MPLRLNPLLSTPFFISTLIESFKGNARMIPEVRDEFIRKNSSLKFVS